MVLLVLSGCIGNDGYSSEGDGDFTVMIMQAYDPASQEFSFRFDKNIWEIEEWPEEKAPNGVALVHQGYSDGSCYILPGTIGMGAEDGSQAYDGSLFTENYTARTVEVINAAGIRVLYVVGYEVEEIPYIFEINFPLEDQNDCEIDAQPVVVSFDIPGAETVSDETPVETSADEAPIEE